MYSANVLRSIHSYLWTEVYKNNFEKIACRAKEKKAIKKISLKETAIRVIRNRANVILLLLETSKIHSLLIRRSFSFSLTLFSLVVTSSPRLGHQDDMDKTYDRLRGLSAVDLDRFEEIRKEFILQLR